MSEIKFEEPPKITRHSSRLFTDSTKEILTNNPNKWALLRTYGYPPGNAVSNLRKKNSDSGFEFVSRQVESPDHSKKKKGVWKLYVRFNKVEAKHSGSSQPINDA